MSKISKEELSQSLLNELKNVDGNESSVQIKRVSTKTQLPSRLDVGEPVYVNDESELYIGTDSGNIKLTNRTEMNSIGSQITDIVIEGNSVIVNQSNEEVSVGTTGAALKSVGEDYDLKLYNLDPGVHVFTKKNITISNTAFNGSWFNEDSTEANAASKVTYDISLEEGYYYFKEKDTKNIIDIQLINDDFTVLVSPYTGPVFLPKGKYGLRYKCSYGSENIINNISVYKSTKCNIKTVLVKNQPGRAIMRKLPNGTKDIIKKHANNKYYFHKKCGQIVFDGSSDEVWVQHDEINVGNSHMRFSIIIPDIIKQDFNTNILCNAFPAGDTNTTSNDERILTSINRSFHLKIAKSKLTSHDITGLKTWLASNPITVIYELDMEQVYECVNLDLDSYGIDSFVLCDSKIKISNLSYRRINNINDTIEIIKNRITSSETEIMEILNSQKINSIGHKTLPGGLLLQWGITDIDFNNTSLMAKEVNYPVMFPNDILFQSANVYTPDSRTYGYLVNMCFLSYEKGAIRANRISGTTTSEKIHVCWMALGY